MNIHYEPHPVTPERKAELRKMGLKILDARFAPDGWKPETDDKPKRGRPPKVAEHAPKEDLTDDADN
jgi:hypothetical protein